MVSKWPLYSAENNYKESEENIDFVMEAVRNIRNIRAEMNVIPSKKAKIIFITTNDKAKNILSVGEEYFKTLASASDIEIRETKEDIGEDAMSAVIENCEIFLPLEELVDIEKEIERLEKEKKKLEGELKRVKGKLSNKGFTNKAPEHVVNEEKEKQVKYQQMMDKVLERLENLKTK